MALGSDTTALQPGERLSISPAHSAMGNGVRSRLELSLWRNANQSPAACARRQRKLLRNAGDWEAIPPSEGRKQLSVKALRDGAERTQAVTPGHTAASENKALGFTRNAWWS